MHRSKRQRPSLRVLALATMLASVAVVPLHAELRIQSGPRHVTMIELFTSQGCSSCPPADRWMTALLERPGLWRDYVPVAFHVDYWDYIGWQDRFAAGEYSARQRRYADEGGAGFVYTPGVFVDGREWNGWRSRDEPPATSRRAGVLVAIVDGDTVSISYSAASSSPVALKVHVALLGIGLQSQVTAGENDGRRLRNDFVVLGLEETTMKRADDDYTASVRLPGTEHAPARKALVVWISTGDPQAPVQSAGGWLTGTRTDRAHESD